MGKTNELEIRILAKNLAKEALQEARKELQGVGDAAKESGTKAKDGEQGLNGLMNTLKTIGALAIAKQIGQIALDLGKLGLQAQAVNERFVAFAGGGRQAAEVLAAVENATGGTIDKMSAMQSASKLMSMGLATNADEVGRLVEMASRLGDQTQSTSNRVNDFALMLANQSIPRLDNFGISSGKVRARIEELMSSTAGLTREQAFLQATMEEGAVALEKLGEAGLGQVQAMDKLDASWKNFKTTIGSMVAPALAAVADGASGLVVTMDKAAQITKYAREEYGFFNGTLQAVLSVLGFNTRMMQDLALNQRAVAAGQAAAAQGFSDVGVKAAMARPAVEELTEAIITNFGSAEQMGAVAKQAYDNLKMAIRGDLGNEMQAFTDKQAEANAKVGELSGKIAELEKKRYLTAAQKAELAELRGDLDEAKQAVLDNAAAHEEATKRILFGFMEQRLAMDGLTQAELMALQEVAGQWGLIDQATLNAIRGIDAVASSFETGKISAESFGGILATVGERLSGLPREHVFTMIYRESGPGPGGTPGSQKAVDREQMYATGGYAKGGWAMVGEYGPEMAWLPRGTRIHTAGETKRMLNEGAAGGGTEVYAPVTINANVANGVDVAMLARQVSDEIGRRVANRRAF